MRVFVDPFPDELLTAYLVRCAHQCGTSPYRFLKIRMPGWPAWARDIDRHCSGNVTARLANVIALEPGTLLGMTLFDADRVLVEARENCRVAVTPFINVVGTRTPKARLAGLQFCPACLVDVPTFLRAWRLSFVTVCPRHQCWLCDRCSQCGAPLALFACRVSINRCHRCGTTLTNRAHVPEGPSFQYALKMQTLLLQALYGTDVECNGRAIASIDLLRGCVAVLYGIKECLRQNSLSGPWGQVCGGGPRLECLTVQQRANYFALLGWLLESWPKRGLDTAERVGLRQIHFERRSVLAHWLAELVDGLASRSRARRSQWTAALTKEIRAIEGYADSSCRSRRAELLLDTARTRNGH